MAPNKLWHGGNGYWPTCTAHNLDRLPSPPVAAGPLLAGGAGEAGHTRKSDFRRCVVGSQNGLLLEAVRRRQDWKSEDLLCPFAMPKKESI
ncbi:hypothetical protein AK812_SmicGene44321 [Symbiodinium microadriaticum]|uniref:Uncharacterized protein n=1 Tax=Symbiodinium microadriaticum TaxID=2951 RepID=A0A1Q9BYR7_SYMMI|nr:hypothetical protein AK812_SmicGene44321 [Symbiodinium microadriaticum]